MANEILKDEQIEAVTGGTKDEATIFHKVAVEKGWAMGNGLASKMAANEMLKKTGITHVNWHAMDNAPADFWDDRGNHYDFATVMEKIRQLPNKK